MLTDKLEVAMSDGVGWLTLNNPERRNAISLDMWKAIAEIMDRFERDPAVRVVVVRGAGGRSFSAGADISEFGARRTTPEQIDDYEAIVTAGKSRFANTAKPLIAAIDGFCIGGGLALALLADLRIASTSSVFGVPAAKLGLAYGVESLAQLTTIVGPSIAKEIVFTGRRFGAEEALRMGLVNRVAAPDDFDTTMRDVAVEIAGNAPLTILAAKMAIDHSLRDPDARDMQAVRASARDCLDSEDYRIGRAAFMAKHAPKFTGR